jgi:hypothetical protein
MRQTIEKEQSAKHANKMRIYQPLDEGIERDTTRRKVVTNRKVVQNTDSGSGAIVNGTPFEGAVNACLID